MNDIVTAIHLGNDGSVHSGYNNERYLCLEGF